MWLRGVRRRKLIRKLLKWRKSQKEPGDFPAVAKTLDQLDDAALITLSAVIASSGRLSACIRIEVKDAAPLPTIRSLTELRCLLCQLWRWPDLAEEQLHMIRPVVPCRDVAIASPIPSSPSNDSLCINPYHCALWLDLEQKRDECPNLHNVKLKSVAGELSEPSVCDDSTHPHLDSGYPRSNSPSRSALDNCVTKADVVRWSETPREPWCHLAYWQLDCRRGSIVHVLTECAHVVAIDPEITTDSASAAVSCSFSQCFGSTIAQDDEVDQFFQTDETLNIALDESELKERGEVKKGEICKCTNANAKHRTPDCVERVRSKIGLGFTLFRLPYMPNRVWIYNRSCSSSLFVRTSLPDSCAGSCNRHASDRTKNGPFKLPCGYCALVHDFAAHSSPSAQLPSVADGPKAPPTTLVSFGKGWGQTDSNQYHRQTVTQCPCWVEVIFAS